jgi:trimethylamine--corrinoid protein Co-methyltransferase
VLSGLALFQMVNPGAPIIYGTGASKLDMQTGRWGGGADEHPMRLGLLDMARFYDLPVNLWGLSTASSAVDAQYGHEATAAGILAQLGGADEIYSMGLLGSAQVLSLEKMVIDNHLARQIDLMARPFAVDAEHLQADLIERVGIGGHYLAQPETRAFTRRDFVPKWPPAGVTLADLARAEAADILATHRPPPLPDGAADRMADIVAEAGKVLA